MDFAELACSRRDLPEIFSLPVTPRCPKWASAAMGDDAK
jgi:hypothetical protein